MVMGDGVSLYWENSTHKKYYEECHINLTNLERDGEDKGNIYFFYFLESLIKFELMPGKGYLVKLKVINPTEEIAYKLSGGYKLG